MQLSKLLLIFVATSMLFSNCRKKEETKECELMYKLELSTFTVGIDSETCMLLASLQNTSTLTPPVLVADIRSQLETGQLQPFTDDGFDQFLTRIYSLNLDYSALTAAELSILNTIREYLEPAPALSCCGGVGLPAVPADFDLEMNPLLGSPSFQHEFRVTFPTQYTCDIYDIAVSVFWLGGTSTALIPNFSANRLGCVNGKETFSFLWETFSSDPVGSGTTFEFSCVFQDSTGSALTFPISKFWTP